MFSERSSHFESEIWRSLVRLTEQDKNNLPDIIYELFWATCRTEDKGSIVTYLWFIILYLEHSKLILILIN